MPKPVTIDFYLDFMSPFGYLARAALLRIATKYGADIAYHPVNLVRLKRAAGNTGPSNREIPPKIAYLTEDLQRWAKRYGIQMARELAGPDSSRLNKGFFFARDKNQATDYVRHAWDCVWRDGLDPGLTTTVSEAARRMQWNVDDFLAFVESETAQQQYEAENIAAIQRGVFGIPTFVIGDQMWWGNDRLDFLEEYLAATV
ncbi:MAG: 2-hydroxychromene-2-carboxylate isomerase [Steroidobacteraceae bacterium]